MDEDRLKQEKVQRFEEFVDRRLKPDLVNAIAQRLYSPSVSISLSLSLNVCYSSSSRRDKVFEQQKVFSDLKRNIENLRKNGVTSLRMMVNLGSEVYMQADVPDTRHIFVDVGLGFHVEFTWSEALEFISIREARLARQIEEYTHLIANIKAQIKLFQGGQMNKYVGGQLRNNKKHEQLLSYNPSLSIHCLSLRSCETQPSSHPFSSDFFVKYPIGIRLFIENY